jgi:ferredoxin
VALEKTRNDARSIVRALSEPRHHGVKPRAEKVRRSFSDPPDERVSADRAPDHREVSTDDASPAADATATGESERVVVFSESGVTLQLEEGQTILEAGLQNGVDLIFSCTLGGCAACMLQVVEGEVEYDDPDAICLTEEELEDGCCLACVGRPRGRVVVEA